MKTRNRLWLISLFIWTASEMPAADFVAVRSDGFTDTGNVLAYVLPATALGLTAWYKDREGTWEFAESATITMAVTFGLKYAIHARRPSGELHSFPSGHAAITFSSAEFLRKRYGWKLGVPAYLFASYVGYSRVRAHEHYSRDVVAGAAIGFATTYLVTKPFHGWQVQARVDRDFRGWMVSREY
ncbi:MAG: phosphoesterase PA-phosphatase related protein [Verrucomicrobia bacterium]|nr:phosphoesterase PA-phosphatase related protein [Verrucomicrobiota bacterium]